MEEVMQRWRLLLHQPNSASATIFPYELMVEILSWLPVKHVMQLRCLNKFFNTLIFDPHFVQLHLSKSTQNSRLALTLVKNLESSLVTPSVPCLLKFTNFHHSNPYYLLNNDPHKREQQRVVGSCNGLLLIVISCPYTDDDECISFWNPAMRTKSENFEIFPDCSLRLHRHFKFSFGYDILTRTYKVVMFFVLMKRGYNPKSVVKVFSLGDNSWRDIQCFPVLPLYWFHHDKNNGVHLNGTINWIALCDNILHNSSVTSVDQYVILSLDLSTETYTQLLLPQRFDKVPSQPPKLVVLMECLCFCHDFEDILFVIWQMKDFGVQESWIQLFKISYDCEHFLKWLDFLPLYLSENCDTLILANDTVKSKAFIYNRKDNRVEKIGIGNNILWWQAKHYVESLVSTY